MFVIVIHNVGTSVNTLFSFQCSSLSAFGGRGNRLVNAMMRHVIADELGMHFNFRGEKGEREFCSLALKIAIVRRYIVLFIYGSFYVSSTNIGKFPGQSLEFDCNLI